MRCIIALTVQQTKACAAHEPASLRGGKELAKVPTKYCSASEMTFQRAALNR